MLLNGGQQIGSEQSVGQISDDELDETELFDVLDCELETLETLALERLLTELNMLDKLDSEETLPKLLMLEPLEVLMPEELDDMQGHLSSSAPLISLTGAGGKLVQ